jgi:hypothetical protein
VKGDPLKESVPATLEIAFLPLSAMAEYDKGKAEEAHVEEDKDKIVKHKFFPGIFLASSVARFVRPVRNLEVGGTEWIGPLE